MTFNSFTIFGARWSRSVPDGPSLRKEIRAAQLKRLDQDQGLTVRKLAGDGKASKMVEGQFVYFDALILIVRATAFASAATRFVLGQVKPEALRRERRHAPDARYELHLPNGDTRFLHRFFADGRLGIKPVEATRYGFQDGFRTGQEDGEPRLRDEDRTPAGWIISEHGSRVAVALNVTLLSRAVRKLNLKIAQAQPTIINERLAQDFHLHSGPMPPERPKAKRQRGALGRGSAGADDSMRYQSVGVPTMFYDAGRG